MVANHTDVCYHNFKNTGRQFSKADVDCHCLSFVAEAQFLHHYQPFVFTTISRLKTSLLIFKEISFFSEHQLYSELRGPPFLV